MITPIFTVVIPTYNRIDGLKRCLVSLELQNFDHQQFEVIVVDDGSSIQVDRTLLNDYHTFILKCIHVEHGGPSKARNAGIDQASGEYIVFFEDDIIVDKNYLTNAWKLFHDQHIDVLEGKTVVEGEERNVRLYDAEEIFSFIPCNMIVRRSIIVKLGGYNSEFYDPTTGLYFREDAELGFRLVDLGLIMMKVDNLIVEHHVQFNTIKSCIRHAQRYYFDPLLYREHPKRYRQFIERKQIMGFTFQRPLHKFSMGMVFSILLFLAGLFYNDALLISIGCMGIVLMGILVQYKYQGRNTLSLVKIIQMGAFIILPMVYWTALIKGCVKFKSYGCLL